MTKKQLLFRLGQIILVLLGISFITFALVMLAPGDVVRQMIAGNEDIIVSQAEIDALRAELGLDKPFFFQYLDWLGRALQGNLGFSYMVKKPVVEALMERLPGTIVLSLASLIMVPLWGNSGLWLALLGFMLSQSIILLFYLSPLRRKFT